MRCFNCQSEKMKTIYPKGYVQSKCMVCGWKNKPTPIPTNLPQVSENTRLRIQKIFNNNWYMPRGKKNE